MKLKNISLREQIMVFVAVGVLVGGGYGLLRFHPALKELKAMNESTAKTEARLKTTEIPELPDDDEDAVMRQTREAERALADMQGSVETVEQRLAPPDSQELRLRISDLARTSGVLILGNQAYLNANPAQSGIAAAPASGKKAAKRARRAAAAAPKTPVAAPKPAILPESDGLLARMAPGTAFHRPMQQLSMEGDFESIKNFIRGFDRLPWQVTIVQLKLEAKPVDAPVGVPQRLSATMILAL